MCSFRSAEPSAYSTPAKNRLARTTPMGTGVTERGPGVTSPDGTKEQRRRCTHTGCDPHTLAVCGTRTTAPETRPHPPAQSGTYAAAGLNVHVAFSVQTEPSSS
jgi:hypothetical protein